MVIMAAMLPGVECARRRRLRQGAGAGAETTAAAAVAAGGGGGGARRSSSLCVHAAGRGGHPCGAAGSHSGKRSSVMELIHGGSLDSNAREAKERLDQKLRNQREAVIKRHHSTGSIKLNRANGGGGGGGGGGSSTSTAAMGVQREVYSKKGVMRRLLRWSRLRWDAAGQAECAVCLEEFAAGDVLAHLPCGHRFHWGCALPWLEAGTASRSCPFCRAAVDTPLPS
ncbi:probable E3 ubiquitin-protein ligase RHY1A isoform X2 [Oryza brachyantha]|uniref:probable E3 ubiquitin-protein ligase RHY1A isoform X2 n=1 Tax=Oryza brachyantha TaxID=4533 RepID=UPI001ADC98A0|nr:probable E3 ubiquitin-protein ligase RHY1A isoform X2 [Oryza brachyantha]